MDNIILKNTKKQKSNNKIYFYFRYKYNIKIYKPINVIDYIKVIII